MCTINVLVFFLWSGTLAQQQESEEDVERWVHDWAKSLEVTSFHADFVAERADKRTWRGSWDFRLSPTFAHYLEVRLFEDGRLLQERIASWDSERGVGKTFARNTRSLRGSGGIGPRPPGLLRRMVLPGSSSLFFLEDRAILRSMERFEVTVRRLDGDGSIAVFLRYPGSDRAVKVYLLDRDETQPVREYRVYRKADASSSRKLPVRGTLDIEPAPELSGMYLAIRRRVLRSARVGDRHLPVEWQTIAVAARPDDVTTISLDPESIVVDGDPPDHGFDIAWPPETPVWDRFAERGYNAGSSGEEIQAYVTRETTLEQILAAAGFEGRSSPDVVTQTQVTNCAANALYLALRMLGRGRPLGELVDSLGVEEEHDVTAFSELARAFREAGEDCEVVRGERSLLATCRETPALLHVKIDRRHADQKHPLDHYYVVDSYDPGAETIRVFDPPALPFRARARDIEKVWTGNALVLGKQAAVAREAAWKRRAFYAVGCSFLVVGIALFVRAGRKRHGDPLWRGRWARPVALLLAVWISGCDRAQKDDGPAVEVLGETKVDLGIIDPEEGGAWHTFVVRNGSRRALRVTEIEKDCSCLDVHLSSEELLPEKLVDIAVGISTEEMVGPKATRTTVVFDAPDVPPLTLELSATVEVDYRVHFQPVLWQLPVDFAPGDVARKTLVVHEFLSYQATNGEATHVEPVDPDLEVVSLGPWEYKGRAKHGYARESELVLEYRPEATIDDRRIVSLVFRHRPDDGEASEELRCKAPLEIRGY